MTKAKSSKPRGPAKTVIRRPWIENGACVGIKMDGQPYRYVRTGFYQSEVTGKVTQVDYYSSECLECRAAIEFFEPSDNTDHFYPARRCKTCSTRTKNQVAAVEKPAPLAAVVRLSKFRRGDRVYHRMYGEGVVLESEVRKAEGDVGAGAVIVEVQFAKDIGQRKLVEAFVERL